MKLYLTASGFVLGRREQERHRQTAAGYLTRLATSFTVHFDKIFYYISINLGSESGC